MTFAGSSLRAPKTALISSNGMDLWGESFGESHHSAVLLIGGAGAQCIMWPEGFCEALAKKHFVMRYDHRDTGLSARVNYSENPYTLTNLTQDAIGILDAYGVEKAHIVGFSMGGQVAQLMGADFPHRAKTLTLIATSTNFDRLLNADRASQDPKALTPPATSYLKAREDYLKKFSDASPEQKQELLKTLWQALNGTGIPFDEAYYTQKVRQFFARHRDSTPTVNHVLAMKAEETLKAHREAPARIQTPTLIVQGRADPIFGPDHGEALHQMIAGSKLITFPMGHFIPSDAYQELVEEMLSFMAAHEASLNATLQPANG